MKRFIFLFTALCLLVLMLPACGKDAREETSAPVSKPAATDAVTVPQEAAAAPTENRAEMLSLYREVMEDFAYEGILPDGATVSENYDFAAMDGNSFALWDVTGDGTEELIVAFTASYAAEMILMVCGVRDGEVTILLREFPSVKFYPGGIARADFARNYSMANEPWPYHLYRFDGDVFQQEVYVEGWDISQGSEDFSGTPFPKDADLDGNGYVCILFRENQDPQYLDDGEYDTWIAERAGGTEPLPVIYYPVTRENIDQVFSYT